MTTSISYSPDKRPSFEEQLQENIKLYTTDNCPISGKDLFSTHREIMIARFALNKQAESYAKAVEILSDLLNGIEDRIATTTNIQDQARLKTDVMMAISTIEIKSRNLIQSVKEVTELLGKAVEIDVDKAALKQMLLNLPSLVKDCITSVTNDSCLADSISSDLNAKISDMMIAIRFSNGDTTINQAPQGILIDQYHQLLNTVPSQPLP